VADRPPERTCLGCRKKAAKGSLARIALVAGVPVVDRAGIVQGRGAYVHRASECLDEALRRGVLARALRTGLEPGDVASLIRAEIEGIG
jgi:hypothetical protein